MLKTINKGCSTLENSMTQDIRFQLLNFILENQLELPKINILDYGFVPYSMNTRDLILLTKYNHNKHKNLNTFFEIDKECPEKSIEFELDFILLLARESVTQNQNELERFWYRYDNEFDIQWMSSNRSLCLNLNIIFFIFAMDHYRKYKPNSDKTKYHESFLYLIAQDFIRKIKNAKDESNTNTKYFSQIDESDTEPTKYFKNSLKLIELIFNFYEGVTGSFQFSFKAAFNQDNYEFLLQKKYEIANCYFLGYFDWHGLPANSLEIVISRDFNGKLVSMQEILNYAELIEKEENLDILDNFSRFFFSKLTNLNQKNLCTVGIFLLGILKKKFGKGEGDVENLKVWGALILQVWVSQEEDEKNMQEVKFVLKNITIQYFSILSRYITDSLEIISGSDSVKDLLDQGLIDKIDSEKISSFSLNALKGVLLEDEKFIIPIRKFLMAKVKEFNTDVYPNTRFCDYLPLLTALNLLRKRKKLKKMLEDTYLCESLRRVLITILSYHKDDGDELDKWGKSLVLNLLVYLSKNCVSASLKDNVFCKKRLKKVYFIR